MQALTVRVGTAQGMSRLHPGCQPPGCRLSRAGAAALPATQQARAASLGGAGGLQGAALGDGLLKGSSGPQGISLAIGITSSSHLEQVWGRLEHLGRTRFLRSAPLPLESQVGTVVRGWGGWGPGACPWSLVLSEPQFAHGTWGGEWSHPATSLKGWSGGFTPSCPGWPGRCEPCPGGPTQGSPEPGSG